MRSTAQGGPPRFDYIQIGTQKWMAKNLDVTVYKNGNIIPNVTDGDEWANLTTGAWCYYNNSYSNGVIYGKLYNWYALNDARGLAPYGWHVPTDAEWDTLINYVGNSSNAAAALKESGLVHWQTPNTGATNSSGFTALPGGYRQQGTGTFYNINLTSEIWSATAINSTSSNSISLAYNSTVVSQTTYLKTMGFAIRCIKD